ASGPHRGSGAVSSVSRWPRPSERGRDRDDEPGPSGGGQASAPRPREREPALPGDQWGVRGTRVA
ncbi:MAG: hypothetical protein ACRDOI_10415, partial [Trebonia sp.]